MQSYKWLIGLILILSYLVYFDYLQHQATIAKAEIDAKLEIEKHKMVMQNIENSQKRTDELIRIIQNKIQ